MKIKKISLLTFTLALLMLVTTTVKAAGFNVTRTVTGVTNPVTSTFTYTVTADSSNPATVTPPSNTTIAMQGVVPSSNTATQTASPLIAESVWTGLNYPRPGTYKFVVSESASSNPTLYPRDTKTYTVTIFVENNLGENDIPTGTYKATYVGSQEGGTGTKIDGTQSATFTSTAGGRSCLSVSKKVTGNDANKDQCFSMTVALTGVTAGETYNVVGSTCSGNTDITVASGNTTANATINIKHGETVTIGKSGNLSQLPVGAGYTITETAATTASGNSYTTTVNGTSTSTTGSKTVSAVASSNTYEFVNDSTVPTPTGIIIRTLPFVILIALSIVGVIAITKKRKEEQTQKQEQ